MSAARRSDWLVLFGGYLPNDALAWTRIGRKGEILEHGGPTDGPPSGFAADRTILVLSAAEAQLKRLEIPARTEAQARAGAAHLFKGAVASAGETLHYAVGASQDEVGHRLVAAIDQQRLRAWIAACTARAAEPSAIHLDAALWPVREGEADIVETPPLTMAAAGVHGGLAIEIALAPVVIARWLAGLPVRRVRAAPHWRAALDPGIALDPPSTDDPADILARAAIAPPAYAPNLRQGAFALAEANASPWRVWRFAAALALLALALQIGALLIDGWRDNDAAARTRARAEQDFRAARPDVRRIVNLRAQVSAQLNAIDQAGRHPVLQITEPLIRMLEAHPAARLDEVRHAAPSRLVHVRLSAARLEDLAAAVAALRASGLRIEEQGQQPIDGRPSAELQLEAR